MSYAPPHDERALVAACLKQDRRAQEAFYRRYAPAALATCRRYAPDREEAMALLNGGMLHVFEKLDQFRWEGSLEGWVRRLVFTYTIDQYRRKRRQRPTLEIADWDQPTDDTATHRLYAEDLYKLVDRLPGTTKEVFWLFAVEGYSHAEIAAQLDFSEGNSRWHLNKARQLLRDHFHASPKNYSRHAG